MKRISLFTLAISLCIPLFMGAASAALSAQGMAEYGNMVKPPLTPPAWVFSVAWTALYLLMGVSSYLILQSEENTLGKYVAMIIYALQLIMNFMWSVIFFNWNMYLFAFIWLLIIWSLVIICTFKFFYINKLAAYLMIPYVLWLTFAAYLNLGAYLLKE